MADPLLNVARRDLVDACMVLWAEMGVDETKAIRDEYPELADLLGHLHHTVEHERRLVHRNVWVTPRDIGRSTNV